MPGLHWYDLLILLGVALLFFGPKRLPEMGSAIGKTIKEFQKSMREVTEPEKPAAPTTPAALPPADAQVQATPTVAAPPENTVASAPSASTVESTAE
jgi:sec-independent protein translocase protein TatA